jgi:hypothetical protein
LVLFVGYYKRSRIRQQSATGSRGAGLHGERRDPAIVIVDKAVAALRRFDRSVQQDRESLRLGSLAKWSWGPLVTSRGRFSQRRLTF